jgi:hypothetical protein
MVRDLVHALPELGLLVGQEDRSDAGVARAPARAAIVASIETACGDRDPHAVAVRRVEDDRVQREPTTAGHPAGAVLVMK